MYLPPSSLPARRQLLKSFLFGCALVGGVEVQGMGRIMKTANPEKYFDGKLLEMARAIESNDMAKLRQLATGQNLNQPGHQDMTLLWFAIQPGQLNTEAVKTLVSLGANPAIQPIGDLGTPLDYAFLNRKNADDTTGLKILQAMLDGGLSPNLLAPDGATLLQKAAAPDSGSLPHIQLLLQRGADINGRDRRGGTALDEALTAQYANIAKYLVEQGARVDTYNVNGVTVGWTVKWILGRLQPGGTKAQYEQLRDLLIAKGMKWPPDPPEVVRDQMRAKGEKVVVPAGKKS